MTNKYLTKIAEKLKDPNYLRMGGRALVTGLAGDFVGGNVGRLGGPLGGVVGGLGGLVLGAHHGWKASERNQLKEQKDGK